MDPQPPSRSPARAALSIVEVMIAIMVITVALFSVVTAMGTSNQTMRLSQDRDTAVTAIVRELERIQADGTGPVFTAYRAGATFDCAPLTPPDGATTVGSIQITRLRPDGTPAPTTIGPDSVTIPAITYTAVQNGVTKTTTIPQQVVTASSTSVPLVVSVTWRAANGPVTVRVPYTHISR